ncbi:MAG: WbqC family protein [Epsilonproteobacteria bacterium]|nr:WbqC family protein [Campylobacterota bacterium]OIO14221.1 MAG: hypothetical protein AUJ81_09900 [Helicobacteraceae bacterium CG1_02_36_14]PIP09942.1 MAG: hypothetical protein COX50_08405 [Sulfurimonas sp. CG23_combo_of_CG06-09_8_20_14_all_36_33]PIS26895.1 MAG: hypothetical protein COT46_00940 [Sulfurimonas sp. CG08_land_8_20_14_0_20_36_33]PIU34710.1 MAG: hypothetical protein COT05_06520 [Sulfurimonas sp. CG07_land_8_20_14_0_80_36_56]PIV03604.1 MAG: hypothetical protein COS56_07810 [Sulfuri
MISIHQSQFLPWLPYFYKILKSDIFIIMDDVQFQKNGVQNRNSIKTPIGEIYLTIPVSTKSNTLINEVEISNGNTLNKILKTIQMNYAKSKYFEQVFPKIEELFAQKKYTKLHDLNNDLLLMILELLGSKTTIRYSSEFKLSSKKDDLVLDLIMKNGENEYISGHGGLDYMDLDKFHKHNIKVYLYEFKYHEYRQLWNEQGFVPYLSIIDLLFNDLENAYEYILKNGSIELIPR